jgi:hypothetical protein
MDRLNFVKRGILPEELVKQRDLVEIVFLATRSFAGDDVPYIDGECIF